MQRKLGELINPVQTMKTDVNSVLGLLHHVVVGDKGRRVGIERELVCLLDLQEQWTGKVVQAASLWLLA